MVSFKQFINEVLLLEISNDTVLYHRSFDKFEVGNIINPSKKFTDQTPHRLSSSKYEQEFEKYRKENYPDVPSRLNCVYTSIVPNSAFKGRGFLYEVKPIGKFHLTMAWLINEMNLAWDEAGLTARSSNYGMDMPDDKEERKKWQKEQDDNVWWYAEGNLISLFEQYLNTKWTSGQIKKWTKWVEVLCEQVKVVRVHGEEEYKYLKKGDKIVLLKDLENVKYYGYDSTGSGKKSSDKDQEKVINAFAKNKEKNKYGAAELTIPKGTKGTITVSVPAEIDAVDIRAATKYGKNIYRRLTFTPDGFNFYVNLSDHMMRDYTEKQLIKKL